MLEDLEMGKSDLRRRRGRKAPRAEVWKEIFKSDPEFFEKMRKAAALGTWGRRPPDMRGAGRQAVQFLCNATQRVPRDHALRRPLPALPYLFVRLPTI